MRFRRLLAVLLVLSGCNVELESPTPEMPLAWNGIIAYQVRVGDAAELWFLSPSGNIQIAANAARPRKFLRWSPSGSYLATVIHDTRDMTMIINRAGAGVASTPRSDDQLSWLDENSVIFGYYPIAIGRLTIEGKFEYLLDIPQFVYDHAPVISRDRKWVYFVHHEYGTQATIYRIKSERFLQGNITDYKECEAIFRATTEHDENIVIVPTRDGKVIVGYHQPSPVVKIVMLIDPETKQQVRTLNVSSSSTKHDIRLSHDESRIGILVTSGEILVLSSDLTTEIQRIKALPYVNAFAWSPDDSLIAIAEGYSNSLGVNLVQLKDGRQEKIFTSLQGNGGADIDWSP